MSVEKFQNKYRIPTARAKWHGYNGGNYFITICTQNRETYFGDISNGQMNLSEIGNFLKQEISVTASKRADMNVEIPLYVIMPNHIHLIIIIRQNGYNSSKSNHGKFEPQRKNLASIIRGIKSATTSYAQKNGIIFGWQSRYHDRIIRNQTELNKIAHYIENNIANWQTDFFFDKQQ